MFERILNLSKLVTFGAVFLYFFGFITIAGFLSRFGIISFEIINARFLIAGVHSFLAISLAIYIAWHTYQKIPHKDFFSLKSWKSKIADNIFFPLSIFGASYGLSIFYKLGQYEPPKAFDTLIFKPLLGSNDLIGSLIVHLNFHSNSSAVNFIFKYSIYIFIFWMFALLFALLCGALSSRFKRRYKSKEVSLVLPVGTSSESKDKDQTPQSIYARIALRFVMIFFLAFFILVYIYSFSRLKVGYFDFNSFNEQIHLSDSLVFSWLYVTVFSIYLFFYLFRVQTSKIDGAFLKEIFHPGSLQLLFTYLVAPVFTAIIFFGSVIYPRIPYPIGGGMPRKIEIALKGDRPQNQEAKETYLLGESQNFIFIVEKRLEGSRAVQINKGDVGEVVTKEIR